MGFLASLGYATPFFQAPMAGGAVSPKMIATLCQLGAMGSYAAGSNAPERIAKDLDEIRSYTSKPFLANFFVLPEAACGPAPYGMPTWLAKEYARCGAPAPQSFGPAAPTFREQFAAMGDNPPAAVSFSFGFPDKSVVVELRKKGGFTLGVANRPDEAIAWAGLGVNGVIAQSVAAGGHQGGPMPRSGRPEGPSTFELVRQIAAATKAIDKGFAVVGAGGLMEGAEIARCIEAGAEAAAMGTVFLTLRQSSARPEHKMALLGQLGDRPSVFTRAFTGRWARGIANEYMAATADLPDNLIPPYPALNAFTSPLRDHAAKKGDAERMSLWAGQNFALCRDETAAELIDRTLTEYRAVAGV